LVTNRRYSGTNRRLQAPVARILFRAKTPRAEESAIQAIDHRAGAIAAPAEAARSAAVVSWRERSLALRHPGFALLVLAAWAAAGFFFAAQSWINDHFTGRAFDRRSELVTPLVDMLLWAPLTPIVMLVCRRAPFERGGLRRAFAVHLPAMLLLCASHAVAAGAVFWQLGFFAGKGYPLGPLLGALILCKSAQNAISYGALAALVHALDFHRRMRDREVQASQLETRLAEARLHVLRMQLQPHFLFNTLHAISALIPRDPAAADRMLIQLSGLLRLSMELDRLHSVPLSREVDFLQTYIEIQRVRFGDRLQVDWDLAPEALAVQVPPLLLQPLVENAIHHGIGTRTQGGRIRIAARIESALLHLEIADDGVGSKCIPPVEGRGLGNTRARLAAFAPRRSELQFAANPGGGARVTVRLPVEAA
jgi:two-component system, LytTR family, sensor kinase